MRTTTIGDDVTPRQLDLFAKLIYRRIGVSISPQKITLLSNRLRRRLKQTGLDCYDKYYEFLVKAPANHPEWENFLQEVTTHETYLFRDQHHWDWLRETFVPEITAAHRSGTHPARLRIWSAACSTGDEATTIASCIADRLSPLSAWKVEILGTDIGAGAVEKARRLTFGERAMHLVPDSYRKRFFAPVATSCDFTAKPILRDMLHFQVHNLLEVLREPPFDLIVLKNVMIYFDNESKKKVLDNIRKLLRPDGTIITGPADGASEFLKDFRSSQGWLHRAPSKV
jgi:chemotaxis protein methyltransferase CheR